MFYNSVVKLLRIVIHYSKYNKSIQSEVIHYIFSSESLRVLNSLQIVNSPRILFLVCRGPLSWCRRTLQQISFKQNRGAMFVFDLGEVHDDLSGQTLQIYTNKLGRMPDPESSWV